MHPILKNKSGFLLYLAAWIPLGLLFGLMLSVAGHLNWMESASITVPLIFVLVFVCLSPWYTCRSLPLRSTPPWKLVGTHLVAAMCVSAGALIIVHVVVFSLSRFSWHLDERFRLAIPVLDGMIFLVYLLSIALHYVLFAVESSRRAEILSREAELKALKAQVNPHFLFNSLNSISALTTADPAKAREMCIRLSEFLRNSLRLGERTSVPFAEELALMRTYLEVEQVRFGQRLRVSQDFASECTDCEVPPLLVQPLIENAIKHGIATLVKGGEISMRGQRMRDMVRIIIDNPFDPEAPEARKNGFGLISVRNRLQARYGEAARMDIQVEQNHYRVTLTFPYGTTRERSEAS